LNNYYEKTNLFILPILILACGGTDGVGNLSVYLPILDIQYTTGITETTTTLNGIIDTDSNNCNAGANSTEQRFVYATTIQPTTNGFGGF